MTDYLYKLFRVKGSDGRSTTVSVDPVLVQAAMRVLGDKEVARFIREASLRYSKTEGCSRSRHVQRELLRLISGSGS